MVPEIWRLRSYGAPVRWISISTGTTGQDRGNQTNIVFYWVVPILPCLFYLYNPFSSFLPSIEEQSVFFFLVPGRGQLTET